MLLTNAKKEIKFSSDIIGNKHSHKEGTFKLNNSNDRQAKSFVSANMGSRQCVSSND